MTIDEKLTIESPRHTQTEHRFDVGYRYTYVCVCMWEYGDLRRRTSDSVVIRLKDTLVKFGISRRRAIIWSG